MTTAILQETNPKTTAATSAPIIQVGATTTIVKGYISSINGLSITDASAGGANLQVTLTDSHGLLNAGVNNLIVSGANTDKLTLTGTLSAINKALAGLTDTNSTLGADPIKVSVTDTGDGLTASASQGVNVVPPLSLSGLTTAGTGSDVSTVNPFANLVLTDALHPDSVGASISFTAANGVLSGSNLSAASLSNGVATYTLNATSPSQLQQELNALVFTPTAHQVSPGQSVTTDFNLNFKGGGAAAINAPLLILSRGVYAPASLATDSGGDVFVANYGNNTVEEFSANGSLLRTLSNGVDAPAALATDNGGNVFVANYGNNTVEEFSASGALLNSLSNGVSNPNVLATDSSGNVFVANSGNNAVEEFSASGSPLNTLSNGVDAPAALATDSWGDVFVANSTNNTVEEFSASGSLLNTLSNGVSYPIALATDSGGDVFVANIGSLSNNSVEEFSASGVLLRTLSDGVSIPQALTTDSRGNVFVANLNGAVEEFSASGALLRIVSNGVSTPNALATDSRGDVFVANFSNNTLTQYAPIPASYPPSYTQGSNSTLLKITAAAITAPSINTGAAATVVAGFTGAISGLSVTDASAGGASLQVTLTDSHGLLNAGANGVTVSGANTDKLTLTGTLSAVNNALANLTDANSTLGVDPIKVNVTDIGDGKTATASQGVNVIPPLTLSGLTTAGSGSDISAIAPFAKLVLTDNLPRDSVGVGISFTAANGVLSGSGLSAASIVNGLATYTLKAASPSQLQQELNALTFTPTEHQVSPGLSVSTNFTLNFNGGGAGAADNAPLLTLSNGISFADSLATDSSGDVFVANGYNSVEEFSANGALLHTLSNGVSYPKFLSTDKGGDVWVANIDNNTVEKFSASGALLHTISNVSGNLATDSNGDVFVLNRNANTVEEFSANGALLRALSSGISNPTALAADNHGDVWVANYIDGINDAVEEFSASGALLRTLTNGVSNPTALAANSLGDVFVGNSPYGAINTVEEFSASGKLIHTFSKGVTYPSALAADNGGNVFVANSTLGANNTVEEFSASGVLLRTLNEGASFGNVLATDSVGDMWVGNVQNNTVSKYAPIPASYTLSNDATTVKITAAAVSHASEAGISGVDTPVKLVGVFNESHADISGHILAP